MVARDASQAGNVIEWRPDVLGDGFECTDLELGHDDEGPLVATLVRSLPERRSLWQRIVRRRRLLEDVDVLYVHGWNDYFFQKSLARFFTTRGARFFAVDLRKYGRSLREGQTHGYVDNLSDYDDEIHQATQIIRQSQEPAGARKLVLLGHSTGGLVLSLWASRNPGVASALVLNSPWLELQLSAVARRALAPVVHLRARFTPHELALPQLDLGFYAQAQQECRVPGDDDVTHLDWRSAQSPPVRVAWLRAVLDGHAEISARVDVAAPACVLLSKRSHFGLSWSDEMTRADTVLEVEGIARSALMLGSSVTVERIDGALHDVFLSSAEPRRDAYERLERWLRGWQASAHELSAASPPADGGSTQSGVRAQKPVTVLFGWYGCCA